MLCGPLGDDHRLKRGQPAPAVLLRRLKAPQPRLARLGLQGLQLSTWNLASIGGQLLLDRTDLARHEVTHHTSEHPQVIRQAEAVEGHR